MKPANNLPSDRAVLPAQIITKRNYPHPVKSAIRPLDPHFFKRGLPSETVLDRDCYPTISLYILLVG